MLLACARMNSRKLVLGDARRHQSLAIVGDRPVASHQKEDPNCAARHLCGIRQRAGTGSLGCISRRGPYKFEKLPARRGESFPSFPQPVHLISTSENGEIIGTLAFAERRCQRREVRGPELRPPHEDKGGVRRTSTSRHHRESSARRGTCHMGVVVPRPEPVGSREATPAPPEAHRSGG